MIAVIFRATINELDSDYSEVAAMLRDLAIREYGCREFVACTEGDTEIAVSYWESESDIIAWKNDPVHQQTQVKGRGRWYSSYSVQVADITREYSR